MLLAGLTLIASYQLSKAIGNASENQGWEIGDIVCADGELQRQVMPYSMAVACIYELPDWKKASTRSPRKWAVGYAWSSSHIRAIQTYDITCQAPRFDDAGKVGEESLE